MVWAGAAAAAAGDFAALGLGCPVDDPADPGAEFVHISEWMLDVASDPERRARLIGAGGGSYSSSCAHSAAAAAAGAYTRSYFSST